MRDLPEPKNMVSYYADSVGEPARLEPLANDGTCDLCIVGGGVTGLSAALHAAKLGLKVLLLESRRIGWAASGRNAGYMIPYVDYDPGSMASAVGPATAKRYWGLAHEAVAYLPELLGEFHIDCDRRQGVLLAARKNSSWKRLLETGSLFEREYGLRNVEFPDAEDMRRLVPTGGYAGGLLHRDISTVHPLKLVYGLLEACRSLGVAVHEGTEVDNYTETNSGVEVHARSGAVVRARHLLLACNAYSAALAPSLPKRFIAMYANIIATAPLRSDQVQNVLPQACAVLEAEAATSAFYRLTPDFRLIFSSGGPFVGRDGQLARKLLGRAMRERFPALHDIEIPYVWGGWFGMTAFSDAPDVGRLSPRVHYAQAIPVVWAIAHGRMLAGALTDSTLQSAKDYELLASIDIPPGPGGTLVSETVRWVADAVASVRGLLA